MGWKICCSYSSIRDNFVKIAVTGASGFIGTYVINELYKRNVEIIAISRTKRSSTSLKLKKVKWIKIDISNPPKDCLNVIGNPDSLIHLAWEGLPNYRSNHHIDKELPSHFNFLSGLINQGLDSLIAVGTCFEYGMQSGGLSVNHRTLPENEYAIAKDTLHNQIRKLSNLHQIKLIWARLFYVYGVGQAENSLYSSLRKAIESGDKFFQMSSGRQIRDFLPVEDAASALVDLVFDKEAKNVVNICSGSPISVLELVEKLLKDNNWKIELAPGKLKYPDYEPHAFWGLK